MGNTASIVPYGAHSSFLNTTLTCTSSQETIQVPFQIQATAPLSANPSFSFTDIYAQAQFGQSAYELNATATIVFSTNASPSTFSLTSSRIVGGDDTGIYVPVTGVDTAGPFTMTNSFAHLKVLYMTVNAQNADIFEFVNCTAPPHIVISTVNAGLSSANSAPGTGARNTYPATPVGSKTDIANLPVSCLGSGNTAYNFSLQGTVPQSASANSAFNVSDVETFLTTSVSSGSAFIAQYGKENSANVPGIVAQFANASPQNVDISRDFTATDPSTANPLSGGVYTNGQPQTLTIAAPRLGSLYKSFTAGASGIVSAGFKSFAGTLESNAGNNVFNCTAKGSSALLS